jgi:glycosyl-4,4'-diaponeurosporenoate acyltransferase
MTAPFFKSMLDEKLTKLEGYFIMPTIILDPPKIILLDIIVWLVIQLSLGFLSSKIPLDWLNPNRWFFETFAWEKGGEIYQKFFRVRSWKKYIPNGSRAYRGAFSIKNLISSNPAYLERWLKESVRAEICHWVMIIPGFLFFLWNSEALAWVNVVYAFLNNLVPIIMQRFNRPRMRNMLARLENDIKTKGSIYVPYTTQKELSHAYR